MFQLQALRTCLALLSCLWVGLAHSDVLQDRFVTAWESLWYQGGAPTAILRWGGDIPVRIHGKDLAMHQERILAALHEVGWAAGRLIHESPGHEPLDFGLDVEIVDDRALQDNEPCYVKFTELRGARLVRVEFKMRSSLVYRCVLHEAMHAMGIAGHPSGETVLSYFWQRHDKLTEMDQLLLRSWYSAQMREGMTPLQALQVLTDEVVASQAGPVEPAREAQRRFLQETMREMHAFASDAGEVPVVLKRSGKVTADAVRKGQTLMRLYLGLAYLSGTMVPVDRTQAELWIERAARDGLAMAQMTMGFIHRRGICALVSCEDSYLWYGLAAAQGHPGAKMALLELEATMSPQDVERARARIAAFK